MVGGSTEPGCCEGCAEKGASFSTASGANLAGNLQTGNPIQLLAGAAPAEAQCSDCSGSFTLFGIRFGGVRTCCKTVFIPYLGVRTVCWTEQCYGIPTTPVVA
jgi:hypothetical protein